MKTSPLVVMVKAGRPTLGSLPPSYRETDGRIKLVGGRGKDGIWMVESQVGKDGSKGTGNVASVVFLQVSKKGEVKDREGDSPSRDSRYMTHFWNSSQ